MQQRTGDNRIQADPSGSLDEGKLWLYHDPGIENGSSHTGEDAGKGEEISLSERFGGRGKKNSGRTGKNQV